MIRRLEIENFQSHRLTELEFHPGVNVLLGETDSGKSAVVRALRWLWFNEPRGEGFVRRGARHCRVRAEYGDGTVVERAREGGRNAYRLFVPGRGEEVFEGFGADVPAEVAGAAGAVRVEANGVPLTPSLAGQMDPPFVIGESAATAAAVIGLVSRAEVFDAALRDANADAARLRREVRALEEEVAEFDRQLGEFADLSAWEEAISAASSALESARRAAERRDRLAALAAAREEAVAEAEAAGRVLEALASLGAAAEAGERAQGLAARLQTLTALVAARREAERALADAAAVVERTSGVGEVARLEHNTAEALSRLKRLAELGQGRRDAAREVASAEARLRATSGADAAGRAVEEAAVASARLDALRRSASSLKEIDRELSDADRALGATAGVPGASALLDGALEALDRLGSLRLLSDTATVAAREVLEAQGEAERAGARAAQAAEELAAVLAELGRCPVCLRPIERGEIDDVVENFVGC